jgi:hypothetical protein
MNFGRSSHPAQYEHAPMSDENVSVQIGGEASGALASMAQVREALQGLTSPLRAVRDNLGELAEAFIAAFAIEKLHQFVEHMALLGTETERTAAMLGIATEEVGRFHAIAEATGTSSEGMATAMERFNLNLSHAKSGSGPAAEALRALGLSAKDLIGIPIPEQLAKLSAAVSQFADGGNKTAIVMSLMGRTGAQMIPVLDQGAHGFEELGAMADRAGTAMSGKTTESFVEMHHALTEMGLSFQGIGITIADAFAPATTMIVGALTDLVEWFNRAIKGGGTFKGLLDLIAIAADAFAVALLGVVFVIEGLVQVVDLGMRLIRDLIAGTLGDARGDIEAFNKSMEDSIGSLAKRLKAMFGGGGEEHSKVAKPNAPEMSDGHTTGAAMSKIEGQIKLEQAGLEKKKLIYEQEASLFQITQNQKYGLLEAATQKEYEAELALLQKEAALGGLNVQQRQQVLNKIAALQSKHDLDMIKLDTQAVAEMQKQWGKLFDGIQSSFNSQLRGLLSGTVTWAQAFKNILGDLLIQFIQWAEKMGFQWLATQLGMTTATTSGAAARATAEAAGQAEGQATSYAGDVAAISRNAVVTFGGVFANLAPFMGPLAAGPAAASQAAVMGTVGELAPPMMATGAWDTGEGLAYLHPKEMVVPQDFATGLRENGTLGGGGGGTQVTIHAVDAQSITNLLQGNKGLIGDIVHRYVKDNPTKFKGM